jgi:hypothetical protein
MVTSKALLKKAVPERIILAILVGFSLLTLVAPVVRTFYHVEVNYNEGWNAYNAQTAAHHSPLYATKYSWTTVNYPLVSFHLIGYLSQFLGDPVLIGRLISLISLLISCVFVTLIVKRLTGRWGPAIFGGAFCLALFCAAAPNYVGMNDPQILAHPFFLAGLWLYLGDTDSNLLTAGIAALFVLGGNIKHNLLPAPIAVFLDLFWMSRSKAMRFMLFGTVLLGASITISMLVGGPFFITKLLTPRNYSLLKALHFLVTYGTLQIPLITSVAWSIWQLRNKKFRIISLYFIVSLLLGTALAGGAGVSVNTYFDNFLAMSIVMGLCLDFAWQMAIPSLRTGSPWRLVPPLLIYSSLLFSFAQSPYFNLPKYLSQLPSRERQFDAEVSFLASKPGPAICESLLRCYYSGKPFLYDPFNGTSLIRFKKLNSQEIVQQIAERRFGAIQTNFPVTEIDRPNDHFPDEILNAIYRYYEIAQRDSECVIYVPRPDSTDIERH